MRTKAVTTPAPGERCRAELLTVVREGPHFEDARVPGSRSHLDALARGELLPLADGRARRTLAPQPLVDLGATRSASNGLEGVESRSRCSS